MGPRTASEGGMDEMTPRTVREWTHAPVAVARNLRAAAADLLDREFSYSAGHLTAVLNTCLFAPSLFTFWFVNGLVDFSTALVIGAVATPAGLQVRLFAYALLVPTFLVARMAVYLLHPVHRKQVLQGACPNAQYLSLDWFSVGILATGLPLALQDLGPWLSMNLVFLVGLFALPWVLPPRRAIAVKFLAIVLGIALFLYANYGSALPVVPDPAAVVGPVATLRLSDATTARLMELVNSLVVGPLFVGAFGVLMNHILTRPELRDIPFVRHTLPRRDPDRIVVTSASFGTVFYLLVVAATTGRLILVP